MTHKITEISEKNRTIVIEIQESDYEQFIQGIDYARKVIDLQIIRHRELFPSGITPTNYIFNGLTRKSEKMRIQMRRIKFGNITYQIQPSFILPYMRGNTDDVEKALFLLRFSVPFWALAYIFGRNSMYWYRLFVHFGRYSLVGTTIKEAANLPEHILADEEHIYVNGSKEYIATTVANGCILGTEICKSASEESLTQAYNIFKEESINVNPDYQPKTVNTDGWAATKKAWKNLFSKIIIIQCFLHAFIKVRDRALKKLNDSFRDISEKIWDCYKAETKRSFSQRIRRMNQWAIKNVPESIMKDKLLDLCNKRSLWSKYYDFPQAYRTSNALDRLMRFMDRHIFSHQSFHSSSIKATLNIRAYALIYNFTPSNPYTIKKYDGKQSPAERLNGLKYHANWLHNLLISASLGGYRIHHSKTLQ